MEIDFVRLGHWLDWFGITPYEFTVTEQGRPVFDPQYYTPGHASREDPTWAIDQVDPGVFIPVHTIRREWFEENFGGVVSVEEGIPLTF